MSGVTDSGTFSRADAGGTAGDRSSVRRLLQGSSTVRAPMAPRDLRIDEGALDRSLDTATTGRNHLFAYPAQSNFSGVLHPLAWVPRARSRGWGTGRSPFPSCSRPWPLRFGREKKHAIAKSEFCKPPGRRLQIVKCAPASRQF